MRGGIRPFSFRCKCPLHGHTGESKEIADPRIFKAGQFLEVKADLFRDFLMACVSQTKESLWTLCFWWDNSGPHGL